MKIQIKVAKVSGIYYIGENFSTATTYEYYYELEDNDYKNRLKESIADQISYDVYGNFYHTDEITVVALKKEKVTLTKEVVVTHFGDII